MPFELIHKPTFTNQLLTIPKEQITQILEKIELLRDNPKTQGKLKKRLHGYEGKVYRLRCGDYRIIYSYGDGWVSLLGVDQRKDVYKGNKLMAEAVAVDVHQLPTPDELLSPKPTVTGRMIGSKKDKTGRMKEDSPHSSALLNNLLIEVQICFNK
jgi:mRNA-degrading endonuclease RelE of RelBE toxin-antitoxin system